jgi:hypothetical protein
MSVRLSAALFFSALYIFVRAYMHSAITLSRITAFVLPSLTLSKNSFALAKGHHPEVTTKHESLSKHDELGLSGTFSTAC